MTLEDCINCFKVIYTIEETKELNEYLAMKGYRTFPEPLVMEIEPKKPYHLAITCQYATGIKYKGKHRIYCQKEDIIQKEIMDIFSMQYDI